MDEAAKQKRMRLVVEVVMLGSVAVAGLQVFLNVGFAPPVVEFFARPLFGDGSYFLREDVRILATVFCVWLLQAAAIAFVPIVIKVLTGKTVVELWARVRSKK